MGGEGAARGVISTVLVKPAMPTRSLILLVLGHLLGLVLSYPVGQTDSVEHSSDSSDPATHRLESVVIGGKQRRRKYYLQKNYGSPLYHHYPSRVIRPPVNFVANGHP